MGCGCGPGGRTSGLPKVDLDVRPPGPPLTTRPQFYISHTGGNNLGLYYAAG